MISLPSPVYGLMKVNFLVPNALLLAYERLLIHFIQSDN